MKIKIIQACAVRGQHAEAGSVLDVSDADGRALVAIGRAVQHAVETKAGEIETRTPEVENRDPKPSRKKSAKA